VKLTTKVTKDTKNLRNGRDAALRCPDSACFCACGIAAIHPDAGLIFAPLFDFNGSVPADGKGGSQAAIEQGVKSQPPHADTDSCALGPINRDGAVAFVTTHWSVVLAAQGTSPAAQAALEKLCRDYWRPLYGFVRRQGFSPEEAEDLTQSFFARLLERRDLNAVRREKGRLRSYLLVALKHFLADEWHRTMTVKRGRGRRLISLDKLVDRDGADPEPADNLSADRIYERRWALTVLEQVLARLQGEYRTAGKASLFDRFKALLADEPDRVSQADIAERLGMTENAVKQAFHRFRERYRVLLREEIAHTVAAPGDVEDELQYLVAVLRA
jgi:RNA polymerase sigma factor (sigma-70 family)